MSDKPWSRYDLPSMESEPQDDGEVTYPVELESQVKAFMDEHGLDDEFSAIKRLLEIGLKLSSFVHDVDQHFKDMASHLTNVKLYDDGNGGFVFGADAKGD